MLYEQLNLKRRCRHFLCFALLVTIYLSFSRSSTLSTSIFLDICFAVTPSLTAFFVVITPLLSIMSSSWVVVEVRN